MSLELTRWRFFRYASVLACELRHRHRHRGNRRNVARSAACRIMSMRARGPGASCKHFDNYLRLVRAWLFGNCDKAETRTDATTHSTNVVPARNWRLSEGFPINQKKNRTHSNTYLPAYRNVVITFSSFRVTPNTRGISENRIASAREIIQFRANNRTGQKGCVRQHIVACANVVYHNIWYACVQVCERVACVRACVLVCVCCISDPDFRVVVAGRVRSRLAAIRCGNRSNASATSLSLLAGGCWFR